MLEREKYLVKSRQMNKGFTYYTVNLTHIASVFLDNIQKFSNITKLLLEPSPDIIKFLKKKTVV